jgi:hypothetical protein
VEQDPTNAQFYRYPNSLLAEEQLVTLSALAEQCEALSSSLGREIGEDGGSADATLNQYGYVLEFATRIADGDHPLMLGTPAEAELIAALLRTVPRLAPFTADEREFLRRTQPTNVDIAQALSVTPAGLQENGMLILPDDGPTILRRWSRWLREGAVGEAPSPTHLAQSAKLLAGLISRNVTFG